MLQPDLLLAIKHDGSIVAETEDFNWETLCSDSEPFNYQHWPLDELRCDIWLGVMMGEATLRPKAGDFIVVIFLFYDLLGTFPI